MFFFCIIRVISCVREKNDIKTKKSSPERNLGLLLKGVRRGISKFIQKKEKKIPKN